MTNFAIFYIIYIITSHHCNSRNVQNNGIKVYIFEISTKFCIGWYMTVDICWCSLTQNGSIRNSSLRLGCSLLTKNSYGYGILFLIKKYNFFSKKHFLNFEAQIYQNENEKQERKRKRNICWCRYVQKTKYLIV